MDRLAGGTVTLNGQQVIIPCNTILQTIVDEDKRSRVMSYYTMFFIGVAPFGHYVAEIWHDLREEASLGMHEDESRALHAGPRR